MDFDDQETKPYTFACSHCGASPTQAGRTQPGTALISSGEIQEWLDVSQHILETLQTAEGRLDVPSDLVGAFDRMNESARELADRLRQIRQELGD